MKTSKPLEYGFNHLTDLNHLKFVWWTLRFLLRYRKHPELLEPFLTSLKASGFPEAKVSSVREAFQAWRATSLYGTDHGDPACLCLTAVEARAYLHFLD